MHVSDQQHLGCLCPSFASSISRLLFGSEKPTNELHPHESPSRWKWFLIHSSNKFRIHILAIFLRTEIVNHIGIRNYIYFYSNCRRLSNDSRQIKNRITSECKVWWWSLRFCRSYFIIFSFEI